MNGEFVPANYSKARFKKKVKILEDQAARMTKGDPDFKNITQMKTTHIQKTY